MQGVTNSHGFMPCGVFGQTCCVQTVRSDSAVLPTATVPSPIDPDAGPAIDVAVRVVPVTAAIGAATAAPGRVCCCCFSEPH